MPLQAFPEVPDDLKAAIETTRLAFDTF